jgi:hypothetical protein
MQDRAAVHDAASQGYPISLHAARAARWGLIPNHDEPYQAWREGPGLRLLVAPTCQGHQARWRLLGLRTRREATDTP